VRAELERRDATSSTVKDVAGRLGGWGMVLFAKANPDTPGKLAMHAYSYEHMELAAYELLRRVADRAGDSRVSELATRIGAEERAMADRVEDRWESATRASLRDKGAGNLREELIKYLRDAHALEAQGMQLLEAGPRIEGLPALAEVFADHLEQTRDHQRLIDERLEELGGRPARLQAAGMRAAALNIGGFLKAQSATPMKLAGFAYAFEALEIGAYELLARAAGLAGDERTGKLAERILREERAALEQVAGTWDAVADAALAEHVAS
jgi:ferritin-like metal-binding protein YciE